MEVCTCTGYLSFICLERWKNCVMNSTVRLKLFEIKICLFLIELWLTYILWSINNFHQEKRQPIYSGQPMFQNVKILQLQLKTWQMIDMRVLWLFKSLSINECHLVTSKVCRIKWAELQIKLSLIFPLS